MAVDGYRITLDNDLDEWSDVEAVEETNEIGGGETSTRQNSSKPVKVNLEYQNELRKLILSIQNDLNISQDEKAKKVQELMTSHWRKNEKKPIDNSNIDDEFIEDDLKPTYSYEKSQKFGCKHYQRGSKLQAEHATKNMMCMYCQTIQPASKTCNNCKRELARYYCDTCKFWDDHPVREIYHCDQCGICRQGRDKDFFHCEVCDCCLQIHLKGMHKCIEKNLDRDCMICGEYLFSSTMKPHLMNPFSKTAYQCPTCCKSIANMEIYFRRIDSIVAQQKMPPEYENFVANILCNDCEIRSTVSYHFSYHKCPECRGYNTKVLEIKSELPENNLPKSEGASTSTANSGSPNNSQVRQSRVMEVTAMMQREEGPTDGGNVTEHRTRNPLNSIESNNDA
ncbi:46178_t:CDS:2 [Gigaspora margarita]|uniref:46178_t:CDS:1 n=1 Tax=Gigaspora margarita TaxID=4874 RepID=A0ABM8W061_GIGMA|nr:46178_t:CDS:2 [Gigaspora margarita]